MKTIEIFRAGTQTDSKGKTKNWTTADLDKIVSKYNDGESGHEAPLVIGHPETDDPAFGWVKKLSRKGNVLFAELGEVVEEFKEAFNKGLYKKRSISLYPDLTLKHVGFLGAQPPAVKGLADFKFSEEENVEFQEFTSGENQEFADFETYWAFKDVARSLRNLREYFIGKGEKDAAENIAPNSMIRNLEEIKPQKDEPQQMFQEQTKEGIQKMNELEQAKQKIQDLEGQVQSFKEKQGELETKLEEETNRANNAENALQQFEEEKEKESVSAFCESLVKQGKLAAGDKELTEEMLLTLKSSEKKFEFGEGDDKTEISAFERMQKQLESAPQIANFEEFAKGGDANPDKVNKNFDFADADPEEVELAQKAEAIAKERSISFAEGLKIARNENK